MDWTLLVKGGLIGFAIAAPVGTIGVRCIRRTIADGRTAGLATGLGAATADAAYGAVAALGLTAASSGLAEHAIWLRLGGGSFLVGLGVMTFLAQVAVTSAPAAGRGPWPAYGSAVGLRLANPSAVLSYAAVFAGAGLGQPGINPLDALWMVAGVFAGSAAWWLALTHFIAGWQSRSVAARQFGRGPIATSVMTGYGIGLSRARLVWVNRVSGACLAAFGVWAVAQELSLDA